MKMLHRRTWPLWSLSLVLTGCSLGPDYKRPELPVPAEYKNNTGWKTAQPGDALQRGAWWELYGDQKLNELVGRLNVSNQNLAAYEAQYRQAQALLKATKSGLFPVMTGGVQASRAGRGGRNYTLSAPQGSYTLPSGQTINSNGGQIAQFDTGGTNENYSSTVGVSWEADVWGRIRRSLEAERANSEASLADLASARLSLQSQLVRNYIQLRVTDQQKRLLVATAKAYERSYNLTRDQYAAGVAQRSDVSQAQTQLKSAQSDAIDLEWQRGQMENAIAVLIGVPPSKFKLAETDGIPTLPQVPASLPSALLERRPDIAASERAVIAANAQIGVAKTAWFPQLSLSAYGGFYNNHFHNLFEVPNRYWSVGPSLAMELFDFGGRRAQVDRSKAVHEQAVAQYRQTVLAGMQEVEDYLVELSVLEREDQQRQAALDASRDSLQSIENQYHAGTVDYSDVVQQQTTTLSNERTNLNLLGNRLTSSVQLIVALGGGWDSSKLAEANRPKKKADSTGGPSSSAAGKPH